jgi:Rrf2 family protein
MLTMNAKHGLKTLADLCGLGPKARLQTREIADKPHISKRFLDAMLAELRVAGMVRARKGPGGGFALALPATGIFVGDVVRVLDGPLAPIACASRTMLQVREAIAAVLDGKSFADFAA